MEGGESGVTKTAESEIDEGKSIAGQSAMWSCPGEVWRHHERNRSAFVREMEPSRARGQE